MAVSTRIGEVDGGAGQRRRELEVVGIAVDDEVGASVTQPADRPAAGKHERVHRRGVGRRIDPDDHPRLVDVRVTDRTCTADDAGRVSGAGTDRTAVVGSKLDPVVVQHVDDVVGDTRRQAGDRTPADLDVVHDGVTGGVRVSDRSASRRRCPEVDRVVQLLGNPGEIPVDVGGVGHRLACAVDRDLDAASKELEVDRGVVDDRLAVQEGVAVEQDLIVGLADVARTVERDRSCSLGVWQQSETEVIDHGHAVPGAADQTADAAAGLVEVVHEVAVDEAVSGRQECKPVNVVAVAVDSCDDLTGGAEGDDVGARVDLDPLESSTELDRRAVLHEHAVGAAVIEVTATTRVGDRRAVAKAMLERGRLLTVDRERDRVAGDRVRVVDTQDRAVGVRHRAGTVDGADGQRGAGLHAGGVVDVDRDRRCCRRRRVVVVDLDEAAGHRLGGGVGVGALRADHLDRARHIDHTRRRPEVDRERRVAGGARIARTNGHETSAGRIHRAERVGESGCLHEQCRRPRSAGRADAAEEAGRCRALGGWDRLAEVDSHDRDADRLEARPGDVATTGSDDDRTTRRRERGARLDGGLDDHVGICLRLRVTDRPEQGEVALVGGGTCALDTGKPAGTGGDEVVVVVGVDPDRAAAGCGEAGARLHERLHRGVVVGNRTNDRHRDTQGDS